MFEACLSALLLLEGGVRAQTAPQSVTTAQQLSQAIRARSSSISINSNVTGVLQEQLGVGNSVYELSSNRYTSFPEVRSNLLVSSSLPFNHTCNYALEHTCCCIVHCAARFGLHLRALKQLLKKP